jgi:hypothetical protein
MLGLWDERAAGTPGEGTPVGVQFTPRHLPNRRIRDPYVRWCGRGEAVRPLPIPIRWPSFAQRPMNESGRNDCPTALNTLLMLKSICEPSPLASKGPS